MSDTQQGIPAVGFLVVAFLDENAADQALNAMKEAKRQNQFYFENAAVIKQDAQGKVHYHETGDMSTGKGAGIGAIVGGILGVLGGPAGIAIGVGAGAAVGAALASHDAGFKNESLQTVGVALKPGTSAVAAITSTDFLKAVQQQVPAADLQQAVNNLAQEIRDRFAENMNVAVGLLLTEDGLAIKEVAANEQVAEVVGAVITADALAVGAAVATDEGVAYEVAVATDEGAAAEMGVATDEGAEVVDVVAVPEEVAAAEAPEAEVTEAAEAPEAEVTEAAEAPEAEVTEAAEAPEAEAKPAE